ncbi:MAG: EAL domain-containing protein [Butyrivibrio sp.]|nr:EAL domain-containing protein [Butyrivibrio sp.]
MLITQSAVIFFDVVSSWADNNYSLMTSSVLYFLNSVYFILFYIRAYASYVFTANVFRVDLILDKVKANLMLIPLAVSILMVASTPWTGIIYTIDAKGYHTGPFYDVLYIISYFYLAASFITMLIYRDNIKKRRYWYSMLLFNAIILAGIICRRAFPTLLLMDTFYLMCVIDVYLTFQNPEFYLDLKGSVFNSSAFRDYIEENNGLLAHRLLGVAIHNYHEMRDIYGATKLDEGIGMIARYLSVTFPSCNVFYYGRGRFMILGPSDMAYEECTAMINKMFDKPWTEENMELYLEVGYVTADLTGKLNSTDAFFNALLLGFSEAERKDDRIPVVVSDVQMAENENEVSVKRALEAAIEGDRVEVFLQPIVDAGTEKVAGAEALCRVRDSKGDLIPPGLFIPIAEKNGRINQLGEQVFEKTCRFVSENDISKLGISWINVNLSPMQFMKPDLAERYEAVIKRYGIDPKVIHLEITEEAMVDDVFLRRQMQAMQHRGFMFVLDDYGVGYSNLTRVKKCSFINVKFDMSIIRDYCKEPDEILPNMILTFKHMNYGVTAEGVETEEMAKMLKDVGCDYLQGYYYSRPLPMSDFAQKYSTF